LFGWGGCTQLLMEVPSLCVTPSMAMLIMATRRRPQLIANTDFRPEVTIVYVYGTVCVQQLFPTWWIAQELPRELVNSLHIGSQARQQLGAMRTIQRRCCIIVWKHRSFERQSFQPMLETSLGNVSVLRARQGCKADSQFSKHRSKHDNSFCVVQY
jgi:hypothetical protein